jgi:hypothetical protein
LLAEQGDGRRFRLRLEAEPDSVIIDSEAFAAQGGRLLLVVVWLGLCLLAARRSAAHPNFQ